MTKHFCEDPRCHDLARISNPRTATKFFKNKWLCDIHYRCVTENYGRDPQKYIGELDKSEYDMVREISSMNKGYKFIQNQRDDI